jgi:hypothetical protein
MDVTGLAKACVGLGVAAFGLAVVTNFLGEGLLTSAEGWSRAAANLALFAVALVLCFGRQGSGRSA